MKKHCSFFPRNQRIPLFLFVFLLPSFFAGSLYAKNRVGRSPDTTTPAAKSAQPNSTGPIVGTPWVGSTGIQETTAELMRREQLLGGGLAPPRETEAPKIRPNRQDLPQNPDSPAASVWPPPGNFQPAIVPMAPQTLGTSFTGATLSDTNAFPPDSMGAVGPTQFIVAVNNRIRTFNKSTGVADGVLNFGMNTFFNSVRNGFGTSDPRIRYDRLSGRWFVIIINVSTPNRVLLAVSDSGTITLSTVWTFFFFQQDLVSPPGDTGCLADYPTLGIDTNALYIGVNQFCPTFFNGTTGFVVRKSSVLGAGPIVVSAFRNLTGTPSGPGPYTPQGVDHYDPAATEGYFIGVDNATFGTLMVRRVTDPAGTPTMSANISITVSSTRFPITVRHLGNTGGTNGQLDALDDRLFAAHLRNGRLWTAHNIGVIDTGVAPPSGSVNRDASRWYELQNLTSTPSVVQSGTLFTPGSPGSFDERNYWIPTVVVSGQGHMALGCSIAGTNERINAATVGRLAGDPLGTLQAPVAYTTSTTAYNPPGDPGDPAFGRRWGDYSYTSLDPCDDMTMWTIQEFCDATNSYGVRIVQLLAPPPATPASASPSSVPQGQPSVSVTITGTVVSGSGFFDPGTGFTCRIGASVSGGVTVNSVTYNNLTSVMLNLSTVGAPAGPKTVTVTNPDGQSLPSASGILTITSGTPAPTVTGINPNSGSTAGGTPVTITGTNYVTGATASIGGVAATGVTVVNSTTITATTGAHAAGTVNVVVTNPDSQSGTLVNGYTYAGNSFFTMAPCRLVDTRNPPGPSGGPAISANSGRTFPVSGLCSIPSTAKAVALILVAVAPSDSGDIRLYPAGGIAPITSAINFRIGITRANNAVIPLGTGGQISAFCDMPLGSTGSTHFVLDAYGYFQ